MKEVGTPGRPTKEQVRYGRRLDSCAVSFTLDKEAHAILRELTPSKKMVGRTLNRLLYEERARIEERRRLSRKAADRGAQGTQ